jgi:hypothetical protein
MIHLVASLVLAAASVSAPPIERTERAREWMEDVIHHQPGTLDPAAVEVASWSNTDLQTLWTDLTTIGELVYKPTLSYFAIVDRRSLKKKQVPYTPGDLKKLKQIAARGRELFGPDGTLRRGAMLHADIAMYVQDAPVAIGTRNTFAPERITARIGDGQTLDIGATAIHWEIARMLVDRSPHDTFARDWYRATSAWMQLVADHDMDHIDHAVQLFPNDPGLLFLDGCMHEVLAMPTIQTSVQMMHLPAGFSMNVESAHSELKLAENALRRAVVANGDAAEWHLHYGRVLDLLGEHERAIAELSSARDSLDDAHLTYLAALFLGSAYEAVGRFDEARNAYDMASAHAPQAQSPIVALMELARRRGDRGAALQQLERLTAMSDPFNPDDAWWAYPVSQARNANVLLEILWQPFRGGVPE